MSEQDFQRLTLSMLSDIKERVKGLESITEERCKARGDLIVTIQECHDDHETRLRLLEEHRALTRGQAMALTAVGTAVGAAAGALLPALVKGHG